MVDDPMYGEINTLQSFIMYMIADTSEGVWMDPPGLNNKDLLIDKFINKFRNNLEKLSIIKREEILQIFLDLLM